jgi:hypothetical protein
MFSYLPFSSTKCRSGETWYFLYTTVLNFQNIKNVGNFLDVVSLRRTYFPVFAILLYGVPSGRNRMGRTAGRLASPCSKICTAIWGTIFVTSGCYLHLTSVSSPTHTHVVIINFRKRFVTIISIKINKISSWSQYIFYGGNTGKRNWLHSKPCTQQKELISPGLSLQEEHFYFVYLTFALRRAVWEKHGGTDRRTSGYHRAYKGSTSCRDMICTSLLKTVHIGPSIFVLWTIDMTWPSVRLQYINHELERIKDPDRKSSERASSGSTTFSDIPAEICRYSDRMNYSHVFSVCTYAISTGII